jgi:hypothetical protein
MIKGRQAVTFFEKKVTKKTLLLRAGVLAFLPPTYPVIASVAKQSIFTAAPTKQDGLPRRLRRLAMTGVGAPGA